MRTTPTNVNDAAKIVHEAIRHAAGLLQCVETHKDPDGLQVISAGQHVLLDVRNNRGTLAVAVNGEAWGSPIDITEGVTDDDVRCVLGGLAHAALGIVLEALRRELPAWPSYLREEVSVDDGWQCEGDIKVTCDEAEYTFSLAPHADETLDDFVEFVVIETTCVPLPDDIIPAWNANQLPPAVSWIVRQS